MYDEEPAACKRYSSTEWIAECGSNFSIVGTEWRPADEQMMMTVNPAVEDLWLTSEDVPEINQRCEVRDHGFGEYRETEFGETPQERGFWMMETKFSLRDLPRQGGIVPFEGALPKK